MSGLKSPPEDAQRIGALSLLCLGLAASLPIYPAVAFFLIDGKEAAAEWTLLPEILALAGVVLVLLSFAPRHLMRRRLLQLTAPPDELWVAGFAAATLLAFVLRESTALFGFLISLLTGDLVWCAAFGALALIAMGVDWPGVGRFEAWRAPR